MVGLRWEAHQVHHELSLLLQAVSTELGTKVGERKAPGRLALPLAPWACSRAPAGLGENPLKVLAPS